MPEWCTNRSLDWSSGVMKPKPLSSLNHLTVPVAIAFPPASLVLRARRLRGKSYDRWHCDVGRITRPDLATVAAWSGALRSGRLQPSRFGPRRCPAARREPAGRAANMGHGRSLMTLALCELDVDRLWTLHVGL